MAFYFGVELAGLLELERERSQRAVLHEVVKSYILLVFLFAYAVLKVAFYRSF